MAGQGITYTEFTQLFVRMVSSPSSVFRCLCCAPFGMSAGENIVFVVHSFQAGHLDVPEDRAA